MRFGLLLSSTISMATLSCRDDTATALPIDFEYKPENHSFSCLPREPPFFPTARLSHDLCSPKKTFCSKKGEGILEAFLQFEVFSDNCKEFLIKFSLNFLLHFFSQRGMCYYGGSRDPYFHISPFACKDFSDTRTVEKMDFCASRERRRKNHFAKKKT